MDKILEAKNITKNYPGVIALADVNFNVYKGKVNVLVGENGAGKSTLMKILSGVEKQTSGDIFLDNHASSRCQPRSRHSSTHPRPPRIP